MSRHVWISALVVVGFWALDYAPAFGQSPEVECGTRMQLDDVPLICPTKGSCDGTAKRDAWIPGGSTQALVVRIQFHVFDPDYELPTDQRLADQLTKIKDDYSVYGMDFVQATPVIYAGTPYAVIDSILEEQTMKSTYAINPENQLNIFIVGLIDMDGDGDEDYRGAAYYPWDPNALTAQGGIVIDGGYIGDEETLLTHEIGHSLGLWHTFHGTTPYEMDYHGGCPAPCAVPCGYKCYEGADCDGTCSDPDCDDVGDFCCDTAGTNKTFDCAAPTGYDGCVGENWAGYFHNYMDYSGATDPTCRNHFSSQQSGRLHCWTCSVLSSWIVDDNGGCCFPNGTCKETCETCCTNEGGTFAGANTTCTPSGACCQADGSCDTLAEDCCTAAGGSFLGSGTSCSASMGACCDANGSGQCINMTEDCCDAASGIWFGIQLCETISRCPSRQ